MTAAAIAVEHHIFYLIQIFHISGMSLAATLKAFFIESLWQAYTKYTLYNIQFKDISILVL